MQANHRHLSLISQVQRRRPPPTHTHAHTHADTYTHTHAHTHKLVVDIVGVNSCKILIVPHSYTTYSVFISLSKRQGHSVSHSLFTGFLFDMTGNYMTTFLVNGGLGALGGSLMLIICCLERRKASQRTIVPMRNEVVELNDVKKGESVVETI